MAWLRRLRARWSTAFTGSTIAEFDKDTGELWRVPGVHPSRERWLLYRIWATWRAQ